MSRATSRSVRQGSAGFTYLGLLFAIVVLGFALAAAGTLWSMNAQRDREAQLLWVGNQYRQAIASYYLKGPPGVLQYPQSLADLIEDTRGPIPKRHLRRLYPDPMTGRPDWNLEHLGDGSVFGVRSTAEGRPLKQAGFGPGLAAFEGAECYCDWAFVYLPSLDGGSGAGIL